MIPESVRVLHFRGPVPGTPQHGVGIHPWAARTDRYSLCQEKAGDGIHDGPLAVASGVAHRDSCPYLVGEEIRILRPLKSCGTELAKEDAWSGRYVYLVDR